jgi:hypothetical protein
MTTRTQKTKTSLDLLTIDAPPSPQLIAHGPNLGYGYGKYAVVTWDGEAATVHPPLVFPSMVALASPAPDGALAEIPRVSVEGQDYWVGEGAQTDLGSEVTLLGQDRLYDPVFLQAMTRHALHELGPLAERADYTVTGLPATWAADPLKAGALVNHLRAASALYERQGSVRVVAEPIGLINSELLAPSGEKVGDTAYEAGRVLIIEWGFWTLNLIVVDRLMPVPRSFRAIEEMGAVVPLRQIQARLAEHFTRSYSLYDVDQAVQRGRIRAYGREQELMDGWDAPLLAHAERALAKVKQEVGTGAQFDCVLIGGGCALQPRLVSPLLASFPHARVAQHGQCAIAMGYAFQAMRLARGL